MNVSVSLICWVSASSSLPMTNSPQTAHHRLFLPRLGNDDRCRLACRHGRLALRGGTLGGILGFAIGGILLLPIGYVYGKLVMAMPDAGAKWPTPPESSRDQ